MSGVDAVMANAPKLLDFSSQQIDVNLLDSVVQVMYQGQGPPRKQAEEILKELQKHPDAWTRVDAILEYATNPQTKFFALQILESLVGTRWKALPREQCEGIKKYVVGLVIKISSDQEQMKKEALYLTKLNLVLVQIVKQEWPKNWPSFVQDIVGASKTNESLCLNNMKILKLLSEEVFDFSAGQMTQAKAHHLKQQFCGEFQAVFQLCQFVMENSNSVLLVEATLQTLLKFLNWIPLGYIFETTLVEALTQKFLDVPAFRNVTLQCLTEISGVSIPDGNQEAYGRQCLVLFANTMSKLAEMIPADTNIRQAYGSGSDGEQKFIANLALFFATFLKEHGQLVEVTDTETENVEKQRLAEMHSMAMRYLLKVSEVDDVEIFKICLDYWNWLSSELYRESPFLITPTFGGYHQRQQDLPPRRQLYGPCLSALRVIMISRMAKPEEVVVVENEQGEVVRETIKDTDSINLYKTMRETLVYLTHLDYQDTEKIMTDKLQKQVTGLEWGWKNLNTLCWAIGSISGSMIEEDEKRFLVTVIRDLLGLCEMKRGKDNKAVIASNIMYVVGQYPRFLRAHWKFLKTVVNKLFEFMHETHEGVQDMACDTYIKISQKCRRHFVHMQTGETEVFVSEILNNLNSIICDLSPSQVHVFYEAVGFVISAEHDQIKREALIERLMALPNNVWDDVMSTASTDVETLKDPDVVKNLANILKTNVAACKSIGNAFIVQLMKIYLDMLNVYKVTSENISSAVQAHGQTVLGQPLIKGMRGIKTEILKLISTWVAKAEDRQVILENFVPPLFDAVLLDYQRCVPMAREPEVLACMVTFINKLDTMLTPHIPQVLDAIFKCTLEMISGDFQEYPEHRLNFFLLIQSVNDHCFLAFLNIPPDQFKLILDSVIWGFKHSMRNVAEISLEVLHKLLQNVATQIPQEEPKQSFFSTYLLELLEHLLSVVTDSSQAQVAGLTYYATILAYMFHLVEAGTVSIPLSKENPQRPNMEFIYEHVGRLLKNAFPHLTDGQIRVTVKGFFSFDSDISKFKEHLRDFLVQIKQFSGEDTGDLFLEEREKEIQETQELKQKHRTAVPGLLNPYEVDDTDAMREMGESKGEDAYTPESLPILRHPVAFFP